MKGQFDESVVRRIKLQTNQGRKFVFVEGKKDKRMIKNYLNNSNKIKIIVTDLDGKDGVISRINLIESDKNISKQNYVGLIDPDYDFLLEAPLFNSERIIQLKENNLETYLLFNTNFAPFESDEGSFIRNTCKYIGIMRAFNTKNKRGLNFRKIMTDSLLKQLHSMQSNDDEILKWISERFKIQSSMIRRFHEEEILNKKINEYKILNGKDFFKCYHVINGNVLSVNRLIDLHSKEFETSYLYSEFESRGIFAR